MCEVGATKFKLPMGWNVEQLDGGAKWVLDQGGSVYLWGRPLAASVAHSILGLSCLLATTPGR